MRRFVVNSTVSLSIGTGLAALLVWLLSMSFQTVRAAGPIRYVAPGGSDTTDCMNSANPCATIQYAVNQAGSGAEIRVASGTYTDVSQRQGITQVIYLNKTLTIRGGYTTTNWLTSFAVTQPTVLDARGQGRVLYIVGAISPTIEGLDITGGNATRLGGSPWGAGGAGGGIYVLTASLSLINNRIYSNTADRNGGGVALLSSQSTLKKNVILRR